jgi:uncharacterized protein YdaU (DUF1376 family)
MAKDPAFLFYPNDFDCATRFFTNEQIGIYLRLLIAQFQNGRLSEKHINIICKSYDEDVMSKFLKDEMGLYYNERLENEIVKRKNYSESRRNNRKNKENISSSYVQHMENENTLVYNNINNKEKETENLKNSNLFRQPNIPTKDQVWEFFSGLKATKEMAKAFYDKHDGTGWFYNGSPIIKWQSFANNFVTNWNKIEEQKKAKNQFQQPDPTKVKIKLPNSPTPRYD